MEQNHLDDERELTQESRKKIAKRKQEIEQQLRDEQAKAANSQMMWQTGGQVLGAVGGGVAGFMATGGNPMGAAAGASAGASLGSGLGSFAGSTFG